MHGSHALSEDVWRTPSDEVRQNHDYNFLKQACLK